MPLITLSRPLAVSHLAEKMAGDVIGNKDAPISSICSLERPRPGAITFAREKRRDILARLIDSIPEVGAIIVQKDAAEGIQTRINLIRVKDPISAFAEIVPLFFEESTFPAGVSPLASIDPTAELGMGVSVGPFSVIGAHCKIEDHVTIHPHVTLYPKVRIGANTVIHAGVVIREECVIGANCLVQPGAVVGADGFGYYLKQGVGLAMVPQVGNVTVGDRVDIGANTCIDRATLGETSVGNGSKIDNLVQIGHNNTIGESVTICGQVGLAGSSKIGNFVVLGGQSAVVDHVSIAAGVRLAGRGAITGDIKEKDDYAGFPAVPARQWRRQIAAAARAMKDYRPKDDDEA